MSAIDEARDRAMGDQRLELHTLTLTLLLGEMVRAIGVHHVRALLLGVADELEEFDRGPSDPAKSRADA
ncbi:hypothetical protein UFOVP143_12 [uncultured Caudovirales phage]|uniref:Uncharacterized protein n=1 Tax=uncultured Caudovirales phage TaxID=2100421 RepID=A0A6J7VLU5_9CAUD|nr:hypothetical protein UFOVP143_12 [uncultured Caudovirales phage]